ncbi:MAG: FAD:protein FMN transferase [Caldimonas sp.]
MISRRRFVSIVAGFAASGLAGAGRAAAVPEVSVWRGTAMGAMASLTLVHPDRRAARRLIDAAVDEVERLEAIFSLYRADSALSRLNADGELAAPPGELVELLSFALSLSRGSGGAFDPTVQPLYRLYAAHFAAPGADPRGPTSPAIARTLRLVDFRAVDVRTDRIRLARAGIALTLNGIAQGFITDRVADLLRAAGFDDVLVDLGEARALGRRPGGGAWRAAIADPGRPERALFELPLGDAVGASLALATSAGYGTRFGPDPRIHHLFDPHTGRSSNRYLSVSVAAPRATLADGLSTTLSMLSAPAADALLAAYPSARAYFVDAAGRVTLHEAG